LFFFSIYAHTPWHRLEGYTFEQYQTEFHRNYAPEEITLRKANFDRNMKAIREHNADSSKTWKKGVNHFTDKTDEEFKIRLGVKKGLLYKHHAESIEVEVPPIQLSASALPVSVDWREKGNYYSCQRSG
jgi:cathepsin L